MHSSQSEQGKHRKEPMIIPSKNKQTAVVVVVAFSFASDWSRGWRKFSRPITDSKNAEESSSGLLSTPSCKFAIKAKGE